MRNPIDTTFAGQDAPSGGRLLWWALVPLFAIAEGAHRMIAGLQLDAAAPARRGLLAEAKTQASIATSYALHARALLH